MWFDTHCHLTYDHRSDTATIADRNVVSHLVAVACAHSEWDPTLEKVSELKNAWAAIGVHPHEAKHGIGPIRHYLSDSRVVAIGECGLDYHYDHSDRVTQSEIFAEHIGLANELDMPLVIHTREAWDDTFALLSSVGVPKSLIFHCFTGGPIEAERCLELDAFISFSGIVTFKNAQDVQQAAKMVPGDKLLVETDAPYLAPEPLRGTTNEPNNVALVGKAIADLRAVDERSMAETTTSNALRAFKLSGVPT